jgi:hypothetical protein
LITESSHFFLADAVIADAPLIEADPNFIALPFALTVETTLIVALAATIVTALAFIFDTAETRAIPDWTLFAVAVTVDVAAIVAVLSRSRMYTIDVTEAPADNESDSRTLVPLDVTVAVLAMADAASITIPALAVTLEAAVTVAAASTKLIAPSAENGCSLNAFMPNN